MDGVDALARIGALEGGKELRTVRNAQKDVPFRQRGIEFIDELFGKTPCDDDLFQLSAAVGIALENGFDRLLPRIIQEGAGVDDEHLRLLNIVRDGTAVAADLAQQPFAVHAVLVTAEGDHAEYLVHPSMSPYFASKSSLVRRTVRAFALPSKGEM